jgi:hypothetical protein
VDSIRGWLNPSVRRHYLEQARSHLPITLRSCQNRPPAPVSSEGQQAAPPCPRHARLLCDPIRSLIRAREGSRSQAPDVDGAEIGASSGGDRPSRHTTPRFITTRYLVTQTTSLDAVEAALASENRRHGACVRLGGMKSLSPTEKLYQAVQSLWLDNITRRAPTLSRALGGRRHEGQS